MSRSKCCTWLFLLVPFIVWGVGGCGEAVSQSEQTLPDKVRSYDELRQLASSAIDSLLENSASEQTVAELVALATRSGLTSSGDARKEVMLLAKDDNLGLYLFGKLLEEARAAGAEAERAFLEEIGCVAGDSRLAGAVLDATLSLDRGRGGAAFLQACNARILTEAASDRVKRIAFLRRAEYWQIEAGDSKRASVDYLMLRAFFGDYVQSAGIEPQIDGALGEAGFMYESFLTRSTSAIGKGARSELLKESYRFLDQGANAPDTAAIAAAYVQYAPDLKRLGAFLAEPTQISPMTRLALAVRLPFLCIRTTPLETLIESLQCLGDAQRAVGSSPPELGEALVWAAYASHEATEQCLKILGEGGAELATANGGPVTAKADLSQLDAYEQALFRVTAANCQIAAAAMQYQADIADTLLGAFNRKIAVLADRNKRREVVEAYEEMLALPAARLLTPELLLELGEYYAGPLNSPTKAIETYTQLAREYPEAPQTGRGTLKLALLQYEVGRFEEAYLASEQVVKRGISLEQNPDAPAAAFLMAACEAALGAEQDAVEHMREVVEDYAQHAIAPRALYWIANNRLAAQQYDAARAVLEEPVQRYPETEQHKQADSLLTRLAKVSGGAS